MKPSLLIGKVAGTEIRLHWTMLLIIPYVYATFRPENLTEAARAFLLMALVFLSVLFHELGHLAAARASGVRVSGVVLWVLGGAAVTEHEAEDPGAQLLIAAAGPLANLLLSALLLILLAGGMGLSALLPSAAVTFPEIFPLFNFIFLIATNLILALSNLAPIYPLDGGRIFRALVTMFAGPARSAQVTFWISALLGLAVLAWGVAARSWVIGGTAMLLVAGAVSLNQDLVMQLLRLNARLLRRPELFMRLSDFDPAVELLTRRIERNPSDPGPYLHRAYANYYLEDFQRALADADRTLALQPGQVNALLLRGALFYAMRQDSGAWEALLRLEQSAPEWSPVAINRAILLRDAGRMHEALEQVNRAFELARREVGGRTAVLPHLTRSSILFGMGDTQGAQRDWEEAVRINAREAAVLSPDRVRIYARAWPWAQAFFAWMASHGPDRSVLPVARGETALQAGEYALAVEQFTQAMQVYPSLRDLTYYRGLAHLGQGQIAEARQDFERAAQVSQRGHIRRLAEARLRRLADASSL